MTKLCIDRVDNGYIVTLDPNVEGDPVVFQDKDNELETFQELLYYIMDYFGHAGSKHDPERIFVEIKKREEQ